jgi:DNA modification methylase
MEDESVHLILTSIPFSTQYEYTPSYNDFGHTDSNEHFWQQMDFLTPELFRILKPGRVAAIHVKDRVTPGGITGLGFQTVYRFHSRCGDHFEKHGFAYMGMKTIVTDVVRENNQTYRLGWTEQCKDGTKMGFGMPEYLLLFRKPPTDNSNGYADEPVVKNKGSYSRSRWQVDAHGFARSNGNRPLTPEDLDGLKHADIFKLFKAYSESQVYDFENHVALAESMERCTNCGHIHIGQKTCGVCECSRQGGSLPVTFMLFQPASWSDEVWSDITRMLSLNTLQAGKGREMHLCPLQFDICDRAITQYTMPGEVVFDPFAGLGSVPYRAVLMGREGRGVELNSRYFLDSLHYLKAAEQKVSMPTLFDLAEVSE